MGRRDGKSAFDSRAFIVALSLAVSLAIHIGVVLVAPRPEPGPPAIAKKIQKPVPVSIRKEQVRRLEKEMEPKPPAEKPKPPEPPKPKPADRKPEPVKPPEQKPVQKAPEQKPAETPPPAPADNKPKPFVLKNVSLKGGVAVQTGQDSNLFGDPSVDAKGFKKGVDAPAAVGSETGGSGGGQAEPEQVVIRQPKALNDVKGEYPPEYKDLRRVVRIELILTIDAQGNVRDVKVRKGAEPAFNESAIRAARQIRFEPATRNGKPIEFPLKWIVVFIPDGK